MESGGEVREEKGRNLSGKKKKNLVLWYMVMRRMVNKEQCGRQTKREKRWKKNQMWQMVKEGIRVGKKKEFGVMGHGDETNGE